MLHITILILSLYHPSIVWTCNIIFSRKHRIHFKLVSSLGRYDDVGWGTNSITKFHKFIHNFFTNLCRTKPPPDCCRSAGLEFVLDHNPSLQHRPFRRHRLYCCGGNSGRGLGGFLRGPHHILRGTKCFDQTWEGLKLLRNTILNSNGQMWYVSRCESRYIRSKAKIAWNTDVEG